MGCGSSTNAAAGAAKKQSEPPSPEAVADKHHSGNNSPTKTKTLSSQAQEIKLTRNASLGSRRVENSFTVCKVVKERRSRASEVGSNSDEDFNKQLSSIQEQLHVEEVVRSSDSKVATPMAHRAHCKLARVEHMMLMDTVTEEGRGSSNQLYHSTGGELPAVSANIADLAASRSLLSSTDPLQQLQGACYFRALLATAKPPLEAVSNAGVGPLLVPLLAKGGALRLQLEASWALTNLCSQAKGGDTKAAVDAGAIPALVQMLHLAPPEGRSCEALEGATSSDDVVEQALWALGNIAGDSRALQADVLAADVLGPIESILRRAGSRVSLLRVALWCLVALTKPTPSTKELADFVAVASDQIRVSTDTEVLAHAAWLVAYLSNEEAGLTELSHENGVLEVLVKWIRHSRTGLIMPALRTLSNLCRGDSLQTGMVISAGGLPAIVGAMQGKVVPSQIQEALFALACVAGGTDAQIVALIDAGAYVAIKSLLATSPDEKITKEAALVCANPWPLAHSLTLDTAQALINAGAVTTLASLITAKALPSIISITVDALTFAIKKGQQIMMLSAKKAAVAAAAAAALAAEERLAGIERESRPSPPYISHTNPVVTSLKKLGMLETLEEVQSEHLDDEIGQKLQGLISLLGHL